MNHISRLLARNMNHPQEQHQRSQALDSREGDRQEGAREDRNDVMWRCIAPLMAAEYKEQPHLVDQELAGVASDPHEEALAVLRDTLAEHKLAVHHAEADHHEHVQRLEENPHHLVQLQLWAATCLAGSNGRGG